MRQRRFVETILHVSLLYLTLYERGAVPPSTAHAAVSISDTMSFPSLVNDYAVNAVPPSTVHAAVSTSDTMSLHTVNECAITAAQAPTTIPDGQLESSVSEAIQYSRWERITQVAQEQVPGVIMDRQMVLMAVVMAVKTWAIRQKMEQAMEQIRSEFQQACDMDNPD